MAHEIGHVLGFNHPDTLTSLNLRAKASAHACSIVAPTIATVCPRERVPPSRRRPSHRPPPSATRTLSTMERCSPRQSGRAARQTQS